MIRAEGIRKSFGTLQVLKGIDLRVGQGEIAAIVGPSGAGKTTLLQIIGTLEGADGGTLVIGGRDVGQLGEKERAEFRNRCVGFVFQFHQLLPEFTALENVMLPALIGGMKAHKASAEAGALLEEMHLSARAGHKPSELSGGEKQRVAVARALINRPSVVLADEPAGSLDTQNKEDLQALFFSLRDRLGQTFVIVTHDEQWAGNADRIIRLKDGRVV